MNWRSLISWTGFFGPETAAASPAETGTAREAAGITIDDDDDGWRRLTGDVDRDLNPMRQDRMHKLAHFAWESNPLANRLIELPLAYIVGKGLRLTCADPAAQKILDRFWKDGINNFPVKLPKRLRELALFGEQCWPVFVGANGFVRVGYLDPALIATVVMDPDNAEQPIGVVSKTNTRGQTRRYRVIVNAEENAFSQRTQEIRATFTDGDCFYSRVNELCSSTRGRSDLLALLDWLDAYDQFMFGELDRASFLRAWCWDVTLKGSNEDQVIDRARKITPPKPGSVRVHNEQETWEAKSPDLGAGDAGAAAALFRNHVLGGATMPEHWYGGAGDVNRSTGQSMSEPTERMFEMRQSQIGALLVDVGSYVLRRYFDPTLESEPTEEQMQILDSIAVAWPELTSKDTTKYASALAAVASAAANAIDQGLITRKTGVALIAAMARQLGVEIDAEAELAAAQKEAAESGRMGSDELDALEDAEIVDGTGEQGGVAADTVGAAGRDA